MRWRTWLSLAGAAVLMVPLAVMWSSSLLRNPLSVMDMGGPDYGSGPAGDGHGHHGSDGAGTSLTTLVADPDRPADVRVELRTETATLVEGGRDVPGYTVNGTSPGPEIRARVGQLVEVHLVNVSVAAGVTLHWHGMRCV